LTLPPWDLFDGAAQGSPSMGVAGGILHLDASTKISFAAHLGEETNNYTEFMEVKLLISLEKEKEITHINIFRDYLLVIKCLNGSQSLHTYTLHPVLEDIRRLLTYFTHVSFSHVYKI
jgi:ribonuclease HI